MSNSSLNRRRFLQQAGAVLASRGLLGSALGSLFALWPSPALAKPGGHRAVAVRCGPKFAVDYAGFKGEVSLFLGGSGYASFDNAYDYANYDTRQALSTSTLSMEWEFDRKYAGNHPEWGLIECETLVRDKSNTRSGITLISQQEGRLFPATMINTLFVELYFPAIDLRMFNREPIVLRGISKNLAPEDIASDPRVVRNPRGLSSELRALYSGQKAVEFDPIGTYTLQEKGVEFYDRRHPERRVAILQEAVVEAVPHYGIDIRLVESRLSARVAEIVWEVRNLAPQSGTGELPEIVWYVGDSHFLEVLSERQGVVRLGEEPFRIAVTAVNRHPERPLIGKSGSGGLLDKGCLFCGAQNAPKTPDLMAFISGFAYTDVFELRQRMGSS